jgi:hypothetical protein
MGLDVRRRPSLCYYQKVNHVRIPRKAASKGWIDPYYVPCLSVLPHSPIYSIVINDADLFQENSSTSTPSGVGDFVGAIRFRGPSGSSRTIYAHVADSNTLQQDANGVRFLQSVVGLVSGFVLGEADNSDIDLTNGFTYFHSGRVTALHTSGVLQNQVGVTPGGSPGNTRHYVNTDGSMVCIMTDQIGTFRANNFCSNSGIYLHTTIASYTPSTELFLSKYHSDTRDEQLNFTYDGNALDFSTFRLIVGSDNVEGQYELYAVGLYDKVLTSQEMLDVQNALNDHLQFGFPAAA